MDKTQTYLSTSSWGVNIISKKKKWIKKVKALIYLSITFTHNLLLYSIFISFTKFAIPAIKVHLINKEFSYSNMTDLNISILQF